MRNYPRDYIAEVNANPIPRPLFMDLIDVTIEAKSGKRRAFPPDAERCLEDAPPGSFYLTDCPENQMGISVVQECRRRLPRDEAERLAQSFLFRWFAICRAKDSGRLKDFVKQVGGGIQVHTGIFEAAADCPVDSHGDFDASYLDRIQEIIAAEEASSQ